MLHLLFDSAPTVLEKKYLWITEKTLSLQSITNGALAERLGTGLQNLLQRFDSARHLFKTPQNAFCGVSCIQTRDRVILEPDSEQVALGMDVEVALVIGAVLELAEGGLPQVDDILHGAGVQIPDIED